MLAQLIVSNENPAMPLWCSPTGPIFETMQCAVRFSSITYIRLVLACGLLCKHVLWSGNLLLFPLKNTSFVPHPMGENSHCDLAVVFPCSAEGIAAKLCAVSLL